MLDQHQSKFEASANYALGVGGITIGLQDVTNIFQAIAAIGGAILVLIQLYRQIKK